MKKIKKIIFIIFVTLSVMILFNLNNNDNYAEFRELFIVISLFLGGLFSYIQNKIK